MFKRKKPIQDASLAGVMQDFFGQLPRRAREYPESMAEEYGRYFRSWAELSAPESRDLFSRQRFHIGLVASDSDFDAFTKRGILVSDTLLLSHGGAGAWSVVERRVASNVRAISVGAHHFPQVVEGHSTWRTTSMKCPNMRHLGSWITETEELLKTGLLWYLPTFKIDTTEQSESGVTTGFVNTTRTTDEARTRRNLLLLDFIRRHGRIVGEYADSPVYSEIVRPILHIDLPFLEGVDLRDFSEITVHEFASYAQFRLFMRDAFVGLDDALHADQAEREMIKIGQQIQSEIWRIQGQMIAARRKRAVAVTGATVGTVGATLVAVYGPAFQEAVTVLGVAGAGGVWGIIQAAADSSLRALRDDKWYYVWALAKKSNTYYL